MNRYDRRLETAAELTDRLRAAYGDDHEAIKDRLFAYANGQTWLVQLVERNLAFVSPKPKKKIVKKKTFRQRMAA